MALNGAPRALHVAAADAIAKSRRASDAASSPFTPRAHSTAPPSKSTDHVFNSHQNFNGSNPAAKRSGATANMFSRAPDFDVRYGHAKNPSLFAALLESIGLAENQPHARDIDSDTDSDTRHYAGGRDRTRRSNRRQNANRTHLSKNGSNARSNLQMQIMDAACKSLPTIEKAAVVISNAPDPTVFVLAEILALLFVYVTRPHWLEATPFIPLLAIVCFLALLPVSVIWRKTDLIASLREGQNPLAHPAEDAMDDMEADLEAREKAIERAHDALARSRRQLEDLKKELAKDLAVATPDSFIVPNKRASELIAAGALGPSYDRRTAEAVEARRKADAKARLQREWRQRAEETEDNSEETRDNLQNLVDHASKLYATRTKEIRVRSNTGSSNPAAAVVSSLKPLRSGLAKAGIPIPQVLSRNSSDGDLGEGSSSNLQSGENRRSRPGFGESASGRSCSSSAPAAAVGMSNKLESENRERRNSVDEASRYPLSSSSAPVPARVERLRDSNLSDSKFSDTRMSSAFSDASSVAAESKRKRRLFSRGRKRTERAIAS